MSDIPKTPRVGITVMRGGQMSHGVGYLVTHSGQPWCYINEEDIHKPPHEVGALLLDPLHLEECPTPDSGVPLYEYQEVFQIS